MKSISLCLAIAALVVVSTAVQAQDVVIKLNADSKFQIDTTGGTFDVPGLDLRSASGSLTPGTNAAPWGFFLTNKNTQIAYGSLGSKVTLDGTLTLDSGSTDPTLGDLVYDWGDAGANAATSVQGVPEPATGILAGLASLGLLVFRRRRNG